MKRFRAVLHLVTIGLVMGAAEVVPGVSGGTIAFISGIYEKLVGSIRQFTPYLFVRLKNKGIKALWHDVGGSFLLILFSSMGVSILLFASSVSYLLHDQPIAIWSFFFGLVIASSIILFREISTFNLDTGLAIAVGVATGVVVTQLAPVDLTPSPIILFIAGAVAICAWILPGLSGSFILLILGLYTFMIDAIKSLDVINLTFFATGAAIGLVCFSQVISRLFARHRNETLAVLTGFMLGSLAKLWPWKSTISYQIKADGTQIPLVQEPVLPTEYALLTGLDADIAIALCCALIGGVLVLLLDWVAGKNNGAEFRG